MGHFPKTASEILVEYGVQEHHWNDIDYVKEVLRRVYEDLKDSETNASLALQKIRSEGWMVAVHNDYRLKGEYFTFWLFTHPNGRWVRGEGKTDGEALAQVSRELGLGSL